MIQYYCKKCDLDNASNVCAHCGKKLSGAAMRSLWAVNRLPVADGGVWLSALLVGCVVAVILFLILFGAEFFLTGTDKLLALLGSDLPAIVLSIIPLAPVLAGVLLALQGREVLCYALDMQGAHVQTWHGATHLKCWARLQEADLDRAVQQEDGTAVVMAHVRHTLWKDVQKVRYSPKKCEIRLYHVSHLSPLVLRMPAEEYPACEALVKKFCKGK